MFAAVQKSCDAGDMNHTEADCVVNLLQQAFLANNSVWSSTVISEFKSRLRDEFGAVKALQLIQTISKHRVTNKDTATNTAPQSAGGGDSSVSTTEESESNCTSSDATPNNSTQQYTSFLARLQRPIRPMSRNTISTAAPQALSSPSLKRKAAQPEQHFVVDHAVIQHILNSYNSRRSPGYSACTLTFEAVSALSQGLQIHLSEVLELAIAIRNARVNSECHLMLQAGEEMAALSQQHSGCVVAWGLDVQSALTAEEDRAAQHVRQLNHTVLAELQQSVQSVAESSAKAVFYEKMDLKLVGGGKRSKKGEHNNSSSTGSSISAIIPETTNTAMERVLGDLRAQQQNPCNTLESVAEMVHKEHVLEQLVSKRLTGTMTNQETVSIEASATASADYWSRQTLNTQRVLDSTAKVSDYVQQPPHRKRSVHFSHPDVQHNDKAHMVANPVGRVTVTAADLRVAIQTTSERLGGGRNWSKCSSSRQLIKLLLSDE